ncbi:MAG: CPXCG motif-containing cysteine-rich protein [Ignavibacteriaceae bacterium]|nr:CPXCG motif-containing cysteine-rich protein [Ignavibacteriaceae bacterium]
MIYEDDDDFLTEFESEYESDEERTMQTDEEFDWYCHYCGEPNVVWVDLTVPGKQDFVEDCSVCSRPNRIILTSDYDGNYFLDVRQLDE